MRKSPSQPIRIGLKRRSVIALGEKGILAASQECLPSASVTETLKLVWAPATCMRGASGLVRHVGYTGSPSLREMVVCGPATDRYEFQGCLSRKRYLWEDSSDEGIEYLKRLFGSQPRRRSGPGIYPERTCLCRDVIE